MKSDAKRFGEMLGSADGLRAVLEDANVRFITVAPSGHFGFQKLGRRRTADQPLQRADVERLAACIPADGVLRWHQWAIRVFSGANGRSLLIERLPSAVVDRLPNEVLTQLKRQARRDGNGVIVGRPGASKGTLLLWLAMQIPEEAILLVSENPPTEMPGGHVLHVYPPTTEPERRKIERLSRLSRTVFWERVTGPDDLRTLFGFPGARRRWFTLDASSISSALRALLGVMSAGTDARIETILGLRSSVIGRPEVTNFLVKESEDWIEIYKDETSVLDELGAFAEQDVARLGLTRRSEKSGTFDAVPPAPLASPSFPDIPEPEAVGIEENTAAGDSLEIAASNAVARQSVRETSKDLPVEPKTTPKLPEVLRPASFASAPRAPDPILSFDFDDLADEASSEVQAEELELELVPISEAEDAFAPSDSFEFPVDEIGLEESSSMSAGILKKPRTNATAVENPMTIPMDGFESSVVDEDPLLDEESIRTGLLQANDLAGLAQASKADYLPEQTKQYDLNSRAESPTSNASAEILQSLLPQLQGDDPPEAPFNLEDLRITTMEDYEPEEDDGSGEFDLDMTNRSDNYAPHTSMANFEDDFDDDIDDYSDVVDDFDISSISDLLSEDDISTSIAATSEVASFSLPHKNSNTPRIAVAPDQATSPALDISHLLQDEDSTKELSQNALRLAAIKQRLTQKD